MELVAFVWIPKNLVKVDQVLKLVSLVDGQNLRNDQYVSIMDTHDTQQRLCELMA